MSGYGSPGAFGRGDPRGDRQPYPGEAIHNIDAKCGVLKRSGVGLSLREIVARFADFGSVQTFTDAQAEHGAVFSVIQFS